MKQTLLYILILSFSLTTAYGQLTLESSDYFPAIGDTLRTATDNAPVGIDITAPGGDQVWNFASLQAGFSQEQVVRDPSEGAASDTYPSANILFDQIGGGEGYYLSNESSFSIIGYAGTDPLGQDFNVNAPFTPSYVERWAPLNFFGLHDHESALTITLAVDDIPGNIFDGLPIVPDSIRVRVTTDRTDLVDAWGTLTIPDGTYEVLREKRTEYRDVRLDAKIGPFPWTDVTEIALEALPIDELGTDTLVTYSFWSNEAKEPIAVINADVSGTVVETVTFKSDDVISSINTAQQMTPRVYIYPNPAIVQARFEFTNMPAGNYSMEIYDMTGRSLWSKTYYINNYGLHTVDVTRFKKGIYLCVLRNASGQEVSVKRLLVAKP